MGGGPRNNIRKIMKDRSVNESDAVDILKNERDEFILSCIRKNKKDIKEIKVGLAILAICIILINIYK